MPQTMSAPMKDVQMVVPNAEKARALVNQSSAHQYRHLFATSASGLRPGGEAWIDLRREEAMTSPRPCCDAISLEESLLSL